MSLGIQFGGLASGLDTSAIIDAILAVESRPIRTLESRKEAEQKKLTLIGTFEGLVDKLREKARDLQLSGNFFAHQLSVGEEGIASFTLGGSAQAGAHTLEVFSLASADRYAFAGVADPLASLGTGSVGFTYAGTAYSVNVVAGSDSLEAIAAAINTAAGEDVTASVVNVGTELAPSYQLVLAGDDTGADYTITGLTSSLAGLTGATQVSSATNALVEVDGLAIERSSNLFSDVLPGVSFSVSRKTEPGVPLSFTVDVDPEGIRENIQGFVDAFNEVAKFIGGQNTFSLEAGPGGALFGDRALEAVRTTLRRALFDVDASVVAADVAGYGTLGRIGIELAADGTLEIDQARFEEQLSGDLDAFSDFFRRVDPDALAAPDERGIFLRVEQMLGGLLDSSTVNDRTVPGLFASRRTAAGEQMRDFDDEIERLEFRLEGLEQALVAKFSALERLLSGLQSQSAFLSGAFAADNR